MDNKIPTKYPCPCCGYKTFDEPPDNHFEICPVCFWEDDGIQLADPDYEGGANKVSLRQAQQNFMAFGACRGEMLSHVRPGTAEEKDENWKPLE
jgi:hypothetical protein